MLTRREAWLCILQDADDPLPVSSSTSAWPMPSSSSRSRRGKQSSRSSRRLGVKGPRLLHGPLPTSSIGGCSFRRARR